MNTQQIYKAIITVLSDLEDRRLLSCGVNTPANRIIALINYEGLKDYEKEIFLLLLSSESSLSVEDIAEALSNAIVPTVLALKKMKGLDLLMSANNTKQEEVWMVSAPIYFEHLLTQEA